MGLPKELIHIYTEARHHPRLRDEVLCLPIEQMNQLCDKNLKWGWPPPLDQEDLSARDYFPERGAHVYTHTHTALI